MCSTESALSGYDSLQPVERLSESDTASHSSARVRNFLKQCCMRTWESLLLMRDNRAHSLLFVTGKIPGWCQAPS